MIISVKRTGGYAGLTEKVAEVNTEQLDPARARQAEQLVRSAGFFNLPQTLPGGEVGADLYSYEITVSDGNRQHTVAFQEGNPQAEPLRKLVETLTQMT